MIRPLAWIVPVTLLAACAGARTASDAGFPSDAPDGLEALADELKDRDVVFFGEFHDNDVVHVQHYALLRLLHQRRPELVLSMEMFERDVQPVLDQYLAGEIDESEFVANARPWPNYRAHYRPMVEFAKRNGIPVVAANLPRPLSSKVAAEGLVAIDGHEHAAAEVWIPEGDDAYWDAFVAAMDGHAGVGEETMRNFYAAQCAKDATMAEAIVAAATTGEPRPLVVHVNGNFHSDDRLGTVERVARRAPDLSLSVVGVEQHANVRRVGDADYALVVPPQPELPKEEVAASDGDDGVAVPAPTGRPALGFMPDYQADVLGVLVGMLREGGPAEAAGMREGDVVIRVGGKNVDSVEEYLTALANLDVGQPAEVVVLRGAEEVTLSIVVGERIDGR